MSSRIGLSPQSLVRLRPRSGGCVFPAIDADTFDVGPPGEAGGPHVRHRRLASRREGMQRRDGRRVVDDAFESVGQRNEPAQPAQRDLFQFRRRGGRAPQHRLLVQSRGEELREDARRAARDREVGEEAGMIPVGDAGQDDPLEVREDRVELFALLRGARRERAANLAGPNAREDRKPFGVVEVIGDPVGDAVGLRTEVLQFGNLESE